MHVIVTGGAGYIGSSLVPALLAARHRVTVIDRFYFGDDALSVSKERWGDALSLVRRDVRNLGRADLGGAEVLVDLAGIANDPSCDLDPELTRRINLEASSHLAAEAAAAGIERLIFASSCSVYGHARQVAVTEDAALNPGSLYARCKAEAEARLLELASRSKLSVTILRFATLFGVSGRTRFDLAINVMTKNAYVHGRITVDGGGRQWRPFVHVRDAAECVKRVLDAPCEKVKGRIFNVGNEINNSRIIHLAYRVRDQVPGAEVVVAPTDPDLRDYNVSFERVRRELDFTPGIDIDAGIREVLAALKTGAIDPDDRRCYTLRQYAFLADVEKTFRAIAIDGRVLA